MPAHPYSSTHLAAEELILSEYRRGTLAAASVLRLSNAVGAPVGKHVDRWTLLVNDLCRQFACSGTLTLRSDGTALRDFLPMGTVTAAVEHALDHPQKLCGAVNLSAGTSRSVLEVAEAVADCAQVLSGNRPTITLGASVRPNPAPSSLVLDNSRLRNAGFETFLDLDGAIRETLEYCLTMRGGVPGD
jgi:UDP-glucose 4-epimerase